ncbi:MAG: type II secretion system protein [Patescibacteria group bacterium]
MVDQRGFTLVEALLSVAIIGLLVGMSLPIYQSFQTRNDLDITTQSVADMLRRAQTYARGVSGDSQWGVAIQSGAATLFKGASFAARDAAYDEATIIPSTTNVSGVSEVLFSKLAGAPSTTGSITLTSSNDTRVVTINAKGMVSY